MAEKTATPSPFAWSVSLFCCGITAGVIVVGGLGAQGYTLATLQERASDMSKEKDGTVHVLENESFAPLFTRASTQTHDWRAVADLVAQHQYEQALDSITATTFRGDVHSTFLSNLLRDIVAFEADDEDVRPERRSALERRLGLSLEAYHGLQRELLTALQTTPPTASPTGLSSENGIDSEHLFYRDGVLAGLPLLEGIPDDLADLKALVLYFPGVGKLERNAALALTDTFDGLRKRGQDLAGQLRGAQQAIGDYESAKTRFESELAERRRKIDDATRGAILSLAEPHISEPVKTVYNFMRVLSRKFAGRQLPELHSA